MSSELLNCPDCKGEVMELVRDYEESIIECNDCKRVWTIEELWNTRAQGDLLREAVEMLKEAHIQIKNFYCDGTHAAKGCEACIFQNQVTKFLTKAFAPKDGK